MKILIVDDDADTLDYLASALQSAGHAVTTFTDPVESLSCLASGDYQCVVTDLDMPGMNGIDVITRLRRQLGNPLIIAMSGHRPEHTNYLQAAQWSGADACLVKPFRIDQLNQVINDFAAGKKPERPLPGTAITY